MNRADLIGRLTKDLELKRSQTGTAYVSFTLAVNRSRKQQGQPEADFIRCKAFGKTAENLARYMGKGQQIAVSGSIATGSYKDKDGRTFYTTDVLADEIQYLESRKDSGSDPYRQPACGQQMYQSAYQQTYEPPREAQEDDYGVRPEDLPF